MSDNEVILRLSTVALLVGFLIYMQWERAHKRAIIRRQFRRQFHGDGDVTDVVPLQLKLEAVRRNYTAVAHAHARGIEARGNLVASARRKLRHLPFFQNHPTASESEHHAA